MKALDDSGLLYLWGKIKSIFSKATNWQNGSATGSVRTSRSTEESSSYTIGQDAVAEGLNTKASGDCSHAEGAMTNASGAFSHAEGFGSAASGDVSHAGGYGTIAQRQSQTVIGEWNEADTTGSTSSRGEYAFIVGNGTSGNGRSNAYALEWDGDSTQQGRATTKDMTSADLADFVSELGGLGTLIFNAVYPVGSYYETSDSTFDPNVTFGGAWEKEEYEYIEGIKTSSKSGSIGRNFGSSATITAPSVSGYTFVQWTHVLTSGWVASIYTASPTSSSATFYVATYASPGGTGSFAAYALYKKSVTKTRWHRTA